MVETTIRNLTCGATKFEIVMERQDIRNSKSAMSADNGTNKRRAVFTGTFDPFTIGHDSVVRRALPLFDELIVAVAVSKLKNAGEEAQQRVADIQAIYSKEPKVQVIAYDDLTIDMARRVGARFIVRGVRSVRDYEYEREQAEFNRRFGGLETVLLFAEPGLESVSSTLVRELRFFGRDISEFLPNDLKS